MSEERKAWFVDCDGQRWDTAVTASTIRRVRTECDRQLLDLVDAKAGLLQQCYDDPVALFEVLCAVVRPQLAKSGLSDDDFGDKLNNEAIAEAAVDALLDGVIGFFPEERRAILHAAMVKLRKARAKVRAKAVQAAAAKMPALDELIEKALESVPGT